MWVSKRNNIILNKLIDIYISTHRPVSSVSLSSHINLSSPAIRKELQKLESSGYIYKASTSSGRIPSSKGIKHYLKNNFCDKKKKCENFYDINIKNRENNFNNLSDILLSGLSTTTSNISFIYLKSLFDLNFKKIKIVKTGSAKALIVLESTSDCTFTRVFTTSENYSERELTRWEQIINSEFRGSNLNNTLKSVRNKLYREKIKYEKIYRGLYYLLSSEDLSTADFFYKGSNHLLEKEHLSRAFTGTLIKALEEKVKFAKFLNDIVKSHPDNSVIFGKETGIKELDEMVLICSNFYYSENPVGNMGVIGPRYLHYTDTIDRVHHFSSYFSNLLSQNSMEA